MFGGVTRRMLPHLSGVPHLHINRPLLYNRYPLQLVLPTLTNYSINYTRLRPPPHVSVFVSKRKFSSGLAYIPHIFGENGH